MTDSGSDEATLSHFVEEIAGNLPLPCIDKPPKNHPQHRPTPNKSCPVHHLGVQVSPCKTRETHDWNHENCKAGRQATVVIAPFSKMPWASSEPVANEEGAYGDRDRERNERRDSANAEDSIDRHTSKDE